MKKLFLFLFLILIFLVGCEPLKLKYIHECTGDVSVKCRDMAIDIQVAELEAMLKNVEENEDKAIPCIGEKKYERLIDLFEEAISHTEDQRPGLFFRLFGSDGEYPFDQVRYPHMSEISHIIADGMKCDKAAVSSPLPIKPKTEIVQTPTPVEPITTTPIAVQIENKPQTNPEKLEQPTVTPSNTTEPIPPSAAVEQPTVTATEIPEQTKKEPPTPVPTPITVTKPEEVWKTIDHYEVKGGLVKDTETELMWRRCSFGQNWDGTTCQGQIQQYNWEQAIKLADDFSYEGYDDWRVPTIDELKTLIYCRSGQPKTWNDTGNRCEGKAFPAIMNEVFFQIQAGLYIVWSSSTDPKYNNLKFVAYFNDGSISTKHKDTTFQVRLVRSATVTSLKPNITDNNQTPKEIAPVTANQPKTAVAETPVQVEKVIQPTETPPTSIKVEQPTTNNDKSLSVRGGKLIITGEAGSGEQKLLFNDKKLRDGDGFSLSFEKNFVVGDTDVVLAMNNSGGTACPVQYFFISVTSQGEAKLSPEFGSCSDLAKPIQEGNKITVTMPKMTGQGNDEYVYSNGVLTENSKPIQAALPQIPEHDNSQSQEETNIKAQNKLDAANSVYTSLEEKSCKILESHDDEGGGFISSCPGHAGYQIQIAGGDARSWLIILKNKRPVYDSQTDISKHTTGNFATIDSKVLEWRYDNAKKLIGLIVRVGSQDKSDPSKEVSDLFVFRHDNGQFCYAGTHKTNEGAREIADSQTGCKP